MNKRKIIKIYSSLYRIRNVEEEIAKIYPTDKIKSPIHLSIGQESISVGVCEALKSKDVVFGTYRGHALYLAKGGNLKKMIAELYGKSTGCSGGKGGSMHLIDLKAGVMGQSAIVGTTIPQAVGYAYAQKYLKSKKIIVVFFGDGAVEEGVFHESMNFAALKKLPIIFICENNFYAVYTHQYIRQSNPYIWRIAQNYGMSSERIENDDVFEIHNKVSKVVKLLRSGKPGPFFFECITHRWKDHVGPDDNSYLEYKNDQVNKISLLLDPEMRQKIEKKIDHEIKKAFEFAEVSPFPEDWKLYKDVFKEA